MKRRRRNPRITMVRTYPGPDGIDPSDQYAVKVVQNGKQYDSFVYLSKAQQKTNRSKTTSWTTFSFSGRVTVFVTRLKAEAVKTCTILPRRYGITSLKARSPLLSLCIYSHIALDFLKDRGLSPVSRLKTRERWKAFANPVLAAIWSSVIPLRSSKPRATSIRIILSAAIGDCPVARR